MFTFALLLAFLAFNLLVTVPVFSPAAGRKHDFVLGSVGWILAVTAVAFFVTALTMHHDATTCVQQGGTYTIEGATSWCRY